MTFVPPPLRRPAIRLFFLLLSLLPALSFAQSKAPAKPLSEETRRANLETQLTQMEQAFLQEDFEVYADFLHPDVLRVAGGADAFAGKLRKSAEQLSAGGGKVSGLTHGAPSRIVRADRELQCTVPQTLELQQGGQARSLPTTLLAISTDGGLHWAFLDTAGKDWESVRRLVPSLSREIVLPVRQ
ncbi:hypothetical protein EJV47_08015 [Hymenobacter gummosus]|uniref:Nuclear transport factor 2 family protein n=1 Tax=Hymenobacter gummosus TaxID=1776032 RepID=A0A3S0HQ49_9BACT|nr:hypothetical protein [Hymenobacter gummosus]RTQ51729.1 hypothetical protein EJV47_08015 [Hymenobacter gummosus]